jgi:RND family efflux transporter MFP subunit
MANTETLRRSLTLLTLGAVGALAACKEQPPPEPPPPPPVTVATVNTEPITLYGAYRGTLESVEVAEIRARVPGFLESRNYEPSTDVEKGQVLFIIEQRPYQVAVNNAKADVDRTAAELALARTQLQRREDALAKGGVNEIEVIEARADVQKWQAEVDKAEAVLEQAELDLSYTEVVAPFKGRVSEHRVDTGNLVGSGENTLLTTVVRHDRLYAYFDISESIVLQYIGQGDPDEPHERKFPPAFLGLQNQDDFPFQGTVDFVENVVDKDTGALRVRAVFENDRNRLYPGLFARVRLPLEEVDDAVLIPEEAVGTDLAGKYVMLVDAQGLAQKRPVELGDRYEGGRILVTSGLEAGDRFIVTGIQRARPGMPVTITTAEPTGAAPATQSGGEG